MLVHSGPYLVNPLSLVKRKSEEHAKNIVRKFISCSIDEAYLDSDEEDKHDSNATIVEEHIPSKTIY